MKRFSVLYLLKEDFHQIGCQTQAGAESLLQRLLADPKRTPVGIYDAKTELFAWEPFRQRVYNQSTTGEQGKLGEQIITIAEALRFSGTGEQRSRQPE
ncbi:hypothetical protein [Fibrella forsythiae]|uniref:Uncharacterized protein n=1 Tax=Fibrella forsythiae TaxID=2817061 RepID=A0ABS3JSF4_9BACT|nr:hypothetical protein [Fibrella forsythiae]MBO0952939.1 hypothetical protein [Fibrella forsythiae]